MCIAILNSEGTLEKATFQNCWDNNPDGAGIAFIKNQTVFLIKEMESVERLYTIYSRIRKKNTLPMIIHFRVATSGLVNVENCHPFEIFPGLAVAHNGIIENVKPTKASSDTRIFIKEILRRLPQNFLFNEGIRQLISGFIEESKLVFLNKYGLYTIINEQLGHWDEDQINWFSNSSYKNDFTANWKTFNTERFGSLKMKEEMAACDGCDNLTSIYDLKYNYDINAELCPECFKWYQNELTYYEH